LQDGVTSHFPHEAQEGVTQEQTWAALKLANCVNAASKTELKIKPLHIGQLHLP
jgi:hypothetical protein